MIFPDPLRAKMFEDTYKSGHLTRYVCEFDFIPNILPDLYTKGEIDDYIMTHPIEWKVVLLKKGVNSDFGMDDISVEKVEKKDEENFIYIFPKPKETPNCFYAILIINIKAWAENRFERKTEKFITFKIIESIFQKRRKREVLSNVQK